MSADNFRLPKVRIRTLEYEDLEFFLRIRNLVSNMLHNPAQFSLKECQNWFGTSDQKYYVVDGLELGLIGYFRIRPYEEVVKCAEIGLDLSPEYQGRGWAKPLYQIFANQVLLPSEVKIVTLRVIRKNLRAINLYKSIGFEIYNESTIDQAMKISLENLVTELEKTQTSGNSVVI